MSVMHRTKSETNQQDKNPMAPAEELSLGSQAPVWRAFGACLETFVVSCAVDLGIADIIDSENRPLSLSAIAGRFSPSPTDLSPLHRVMRFLTRKGFFGKTKDPGTGEALYALTPLSKWLVKSSTPTLAPMFPLATIQFFRNSPPAYLSDCVRRGGIPFKLAHGTDIWSFMSEDAEYNDVFNSKMACTAEIDVRASLDVYKEGFESLGSIVDVGGGTGIVLGEIVRRFPNIRGINFDQPHVISGAPEYPSVTHVVGDMFNDDIPTADAIMLKWILHCFDDDGCVKILKNCGRSLAKTGKMIIVDNIMSDEEGVAGDICVDMDIGMLILTGGKERTEEEWGKLLKAANFPRYNVIKLTPTSSIIEAYAN